jgi:hypothetical protein
MHFYDYLTNKQLDSKLETINLTNLKYLTIGDIISGISESYIYFAAFVSHQNLSHTVYLSTNF